MSANNQTGFPPGQQWSRKWGKNQIVKCNFVTHHQCNVVRCLVITKLMGDDGVCVCTSDSIKLSKGSYKLHIYSSEMSHIRHLHSSAETCDFAVSSNSCCCESHNKIKWWKGSSKIAPSVENGCCNAMDYAKNNFFKWGKWCTLFFLFLSFFHSYCCFMGKINNE